MMPPNETTSMTMVRPPANAVAAPGPKRMTAPPFPGGASSRHGRGYAAFQTMPRARWTLRMMERASSSGRPDAAARSMVSRSMRAHSSGWFT